MTSRSLWILLGATGSLNCCDKEIAVAKGKALATSWVCFSEVYVKNTSKKPC